MHRLNVVLFSSLPLSFNCQFCCRIIVMMRHRYSNPQTSDVTCSCECEFQLLKFNIQRKSLPLLHKTSQMVL